MSGTRSCGPAHLRDARQHIGHLFRQTGTLTRNEMTVRQCVADERIFEVTGAGYDAKGEILEDGRAIEPPDSVRALLTAGALASDARLVTRDGRSQVEGDPTEGALIVAAMKAGLNPGHLNERGKPFAAHSIKAMIEGARPAKR